MHGFSVVYDCLCDPMDYSLHGSSVHGFSGKNTGMGCHFLLQGIFPTQGSNLHLLHWQMDSLLLSQLGNPILLWSFCLIISFVVNLLLCLIYGLNFTIDMYVWEKTVCVGLNNVHGFRHPLGVLECNHHRQGETTTTSRDSKRSFLGHTNFLTCFPCSRVYALLNFFFFYSLGGYEHLKYRGSKASGLN